MPAQKRQGLDIEVEPLLPAEATDPEESIGDRARRRQRWNIAKAEVDRASGVRREPCRERLLAPRIAGEHDDARPGGIDRPVDCWMAPGSSHRSRDESRQRQPPSSSEFARDRFQAQEDGVRVYVRDEPRQAGSFARNARDHGIVLVSADAPLERAHQV